MPRSDKSPYDAQQNHDAKHHSQNHVYREERAVVIGREGNSGRYDEADCQQPVEDPRWKVPNEYSRHGRPLIESGLARHFKTRLSASQRSPRQIPVRITNIPQTGIRHSLMLMIQRSSNAKLPVAEELTHMHPIPHSVRSKGSVCQRRDANHLKVSQSR